MPTTKTAAKTAKKTFNATITPATIVKGDTANGVRYSTMRDASVVSKGLRGKMVEKTRTVMAFGRSNAEVANSLRPGKPVECVCQWDGATVRILGRVKKAA